MNKIIVLDDEPANIFVIEGLLVENGYDVISFEEPLKCIDYLQSNPADVLLLDLMMPGMSGLEVLDVIKSDEKLKDILVLMVTAKTDSGALEDSFEKGAVDYIRKPFEEVELLARVKVAIQLKENEKHLKALIKQRDDFVRIVSHDLRTPLTTIQGFAELIMDDKNISEKQKESLQFIIDSASYSSDYFNKLLSWALLESGDLKMTMSVNNLKHLVQMCLKVFTNKLSEKELTIGLNIPEDINVYVDETYFKQVINNLLNNSIKFSHPKGKISLELETTNTENILKISDEGVGIPENVLSTLFTGSISGSTRGTSGEKGTGVGIYICRKILSAHNHKFTCTSKVNSGSTFYISIPINPVP
jgi:two-component system, sensor histidine kinase and response regulator